MFHIQNIHFPFFFRFSVKNLFIFSQNSISKPTEPKSLWEKILSCKENPPKNPPNARQGKKSAKPVFFMHKPRPDYPNLSIRAVEKLVTELDSHAESQFPWFQNQIPTTGRLVFENRTRNSLS